MKSMQKKKVLVFLAKAFEIMEFSVFIDVLGWARNDYGHNLFVDSCGFNDKVISTFDVPIIVDKTIEQINVDEYDALAITSWCPETAPKVAFELLKMLTSEEEMTVIKKAMGF